jgi:transcriptional regulator with XRE-family HTH domain
MAKSFAELARKTMTKADRAQAHRRAREMLVAMLLSELRAAVGPTQKELARRLGVAQPTLARMEKQADMQVTTLQRIVEALGGRLTILADFPKGSVVIRPFGKGQKTSTRRRRTRARQAA